MQPKHIRVKWRRSVRISPSLQLHSNIGKKAQLAHTASVSEPDTASAAGRSSVSEFRKQLFLRDETLHCFRHKDQFVVVVQARPRGPPLPRAAVGGRLLQMQPGLAGGTHTHTHTRVRQEGQVFPGSAGNCLMRLCQQWPSHCEAAGLLRFSTL